MKRVLGIFLFFVVFCLPTTAQITPAWEVGAGYTFRSYYPPLASRFATNGWDASLEHNYKHWLGFALDATGTYRDLGINRGQYSIYELLAGPRIYPFRHKHKLVLYGQGLFGVGYLRLHYPANGGFGALTNSSTKFAWAVGGGLDRRLKEHWAVRIFEFDYEHTNFPAFNGNTLKYSEGNYRISIGLVYHIGEK